MTITTTMIKVGIADLKTAKAPNMLKTSGLGSCVGVVVYETSQKIAGLAHVMLPDSTVSKRETNNAMKYADTALDILLKELQEHGAKKYALRAKMAGGAHMFSFRSDNKMLRIGDRNVEAVRNILARYSIPILAEDVGGNKGRTIEFNIETSMLEIRTVNAGTTII
ncbi:chemotaxis protein CheD [Gracilibacillus oryzae]|uniref:Probable chemoreceptor glutamine deamidase CheD n=1 Tax=Gracilibacillus oryzae TaxID=1672701 RepID=A0A7C8GVA4_9BACI|nr:chemotaxis protein CheD [Gracilibacillus oryzae]KAB8138760.1 chemotaxis protein CheD [Gracilibacillus oryzae]